MLATALLCAQVFAFAPVSGEATQGTSTAADTQQAPSARSRRPFFRFNQATTRFLHEGKGPSHRYMVGISAVLTQAPPLRGTLFYIDPRTVGRSVLLAGAGAFFRARVRPLVGFDVEFQTASNRYRRSDIDASLGHNMFRIDAGTLLYLGRGRIAQVALSGGIGGQATLLRYRLDGRDSRQSYGAFTTRFGGEAEFLLKPIALTLSVRWYGVVTDRNHARTTGPAFNEPELTRPPVTTFVSLFTASAGIAYRF